MSDSQPQPGDHFFDPQTGERFFVCCACHHVFPSDPDYSEEDRLAEMIAVHAEPVPPEKRRSVCDACYQRFLPQLLARQGIVQEKG